MDKPLLRNALKKLRALPLDRANHPNVMMAPQEMLDFLAMLAGIKPVFLTGRGFDDPQWVQGAAAMARQTGLHVIEGPLWNAQGPDESLPPWFREHMDAAQPEGTAVYICRARGVAEAVEASFKTPPIAMEEEARLLGYPPCCVRAHYKRDTLVGRVFYMLLQRAGRGDTAEMQRILREDIAMSPETPDEEAAVRQATEFIPAPFTSFHMCAACAADPALPAAQISRRYEELARAVDDDLAAQIAAHQEGVGRSG